MDYLGKGEVLTNTYLDRFVNDIWEKFSVAIKNPMALLVKSRGVTPVS